MGRAASCQLSRTTAHPSWRATRYAAPRADTLDSTYCQVTGFSNTEEEAVGKTSVVPWLLEDKLKELGAVYSRGPDWTEYVVTDRNVATGQNPQSSTGVAKAVLALLG